MDRQVKHIISEKAKKLYSTDKMVADYYALYDDIVNNKKVLIIDVNYKYSSTGQIVYELYANAQKYNKEVTVCYGRGIGVKEKNVFKFGLDFETYMHAFLSRITGYNGCFSYMSTKRLINVIEKVKPDIIHIHELHAYFVNIKQLMNYVKKKQIPIVWTFHCEFMYTGKCGHAYDCTNFQDICGNCPAIREYPKSLWFDKTAKMLKQKKEMLEDFDFTIVTPSKWMERRVRLSFLKNKKIQTVYNGIDVNVFYPRNAEALRKDLGIPTNKKIALFVAPLVFDENKGWQWIEKLAKSMKDEDVIFILVGQGDIVGEWPENMIFIGSIRDKNILATYYSVADVFLLCSKRETYSMTCAEALCCGTPVVGYESGAPETVFKGEFATFVPYGDIEQLKQELLAMIRKCEVR